MTTDRSTKRTAGLPGCRSRLQVTRGHSARTVGALVGRRPWQRAIVLGHRRCRGRSRRAVQGSGLEGQGHRRRRFLAPNGARGRGQRPPPSAEFPQAVPGNGVGEWLSLRPFLSSFTLPGREGSRFYGRLACQANNNEADASNPLSPAQWSSSIRHRRIAMSPQLYANAPRTTYLVNGCRLPDRLVPRIRRLKHR